MTPADIAMKDALDEYAQYARSSPNMASPATPLVFRHPEANVTRYDFDNQASRISRIRSDPPTTPHLTLHQFRKFQESPAFASSDIDYKRVRRKRSFKHLVRPSLDSAPFSDAATSSLHLTSPTSLEKFHPSLLPPLPLTPQARPSTAAPSLSSTVDTIQSTPAQTPIQQVDWPLPQWRVFEGVEFVEPIRTKRKFSTLKLPKRLPHHTAQDGESEVWQVHAAVIDLGIGVGDLIGLEEDSPALEVPEHPVPGRQGEVRKPATLSPSAKKGRSVRFEGIGSETESSESDAVQSGKGKDATLSSSYSLSKFQFPAPPGHNWAGTFGHLKESTPPTSPATLHYRGTSFDVVNPHASLLLGSNDIETPAEIDGLLDDYFDTGDPSIAMPYDDITGEMSTSQLSLQTSSSGRQRILYNDPDSARRTIMNIRDSISQPVFSNTRVEDSPLANRGQRGFLPTSSSGPQWYATAPSRPNDFAGERATPSGLQLHPVSREALHAVPPSHPADFSDQHLFEHAQSRDPSNHSRADDPVVTNARASSVYPHSDQFSLTVSDDTDDHRFSNIANVVGHGRRSYYAGNRVYYNQEEDFAVYEDGADADAYRNTLEPDTTLGNILSHYNYSRDPLAPLDDEERGGFRSEDTHSTSLELGRVQNQASDDGDVFIRPDDGSRFDTMIGAFENPHRASRMQNPPSFAFNNPYRNSLQEYRLFGPPGYSPPTPHISGAQRHGPYYQPSELTDVPTTDQTYGNTGQLLQLTPDDTRHRHLGGRTSNESELEYRGGENKENARPRPTRVPGFYPTPILPRSSSYYPDNDSIWESTQASESRANLANDSARPSYESYADTSVSGNRLSMLARTSIGVPPPDLPHLSLPVRLAAQQTDTEHSSAPALLLGTRDASEALPEDHAGSTDQERARKVLGIKALEKRPDEGPFNSNSPTEGVQHNIRAKEGEQLRLGHSTALARAAVKAVAQKLGNLSPIQPAYSPQGTFKMTSIPSNRRLHQRASAEGHGLLTDDGSPYMSGGLRVNESTNTFQSSRSALSALDDRSVDAYSPLTPSPITPPTTALLRDHAKVSSPLINPFELAEETPTSETIRLQRVRKYKPRVVSRTAMSSQTELQPLQLVESTAASGITGRRLTDAELAEAEPGWTVRPDFSQAGALARSGNQITRPTNFVIQQADGTTEHVSLLMNPGDASRISMRREQKKLTKPYLQYCCAFPLTALLFGLGCFDFRIRSKTNGRVYEMLPQSKRAALMVYFPLCTIIYTCFGLSVAMIIVASQ